MELIIVHVSIRFESFLASLLNDQIKGGVEYGFGYFNGCSHCAGVCDIRLCILEMMSGRDVAQSLISDISSEKKGKK